MTEDEMVGWRHNLNGHELQQASGPGEGNVNPFQYSCLGNSMDKGAWQATVHEIAEPEFQIQHQSFQ